MALELTGVAAFSYCAIPLWSWQFCFIKQYLVQSFGLRLYVCHTNIWERFEKSTIDCHTNISDLLTALGKTYFRDPDLREKLLFNCLLRLPPASLTVVMCISTLKKCLHRVYFIVQKYAYLIRGKYTLIIRISIYTYQQKYPCLCKYIQLNRKWI